MELPENLKLRLDTAQGEHQPDRLGRGPDLALPADGAPIDEAESQMRKALGLLGETPRHRPDADRSDMAGRLGGERFNGGLHRRRFVQDGDVPVTVLRRDQGVEVPAHRTVTPSVPPQTSRLQRTEAALAAETAAREKAERLLSETQSIVRDLQTKIGHAELARQEAIEALRVEREATAAIRAQEEERAARLQQAIEHAEAAEAGAQAYQEQLLEERQARKNAEKALRSAEAAREAAEQLVESLTREAQEIRPVTVRPTKPVATRPERSVPEPKAKGAAPQLAASLKRRPSADAGTEPEPVKWWLNAKPVTKRR